MRLSVRPLVTGFPFSPGFLFLGSIPSVVICPWVSLSCEHRCACEEEECFVGNCLDRSPRLLLCILEHINILEEPLYFEVIVLNIIMQRQEAKGMATCAPRLEVGKKLFWCNVSIKVSVSWSSCTHVSLTTARMTCAVSRHSIS